jgi:PAS domain S-box-containing protein
MATPLRILIVEDSEDDAKYLLRELEQNGFDPTFERVETSEAMAAALGDKPWDIVISDYIMPHFSGTNALKVLKDSGHDLPFIIVSGKIGEDVAVEVMKAGAHDYLLKYNYKKLGVIIRREMAEALIRADRRKAEAALRESEEHFRSLFKNMINGFVLYDVIRDGQGKAIDVRYIDINPAFERIIGLSREDVIGKTLLEVFPEIGNDRIREYGVIGTEGEPIMVQRDRYDTGQYFETTIYSPSRDHVAVIFQDITERKKAEVRQKSRLDLLNGLSKAKSVDECLPLICNAVIGAQLFKRALFFLGGPDGLITNFCACGFDKAVNKRLRGARIPDIKNLKNAFQPKFRINDANLIPAEKVSAIARLFQIIPDLPDSQSSESWENGDVLLVPIKIVTGDIEGWFWLDSPFNSKDTIQDNITYIEDISTTVAFKIYQIRLNQELASEQKALEEKNITLKEVLATIEVEKRDIKRQIAEVVDEVLLPAATKMIRRNGTLNMAFYRLLISNLKELAEASGSALYGYSKLSPREQEVCSLIKSGAASKEIAEALGIAPMTVLKHREIIRKKLGLTNKSVNLVTYLRNLQSGE